MQSSLNQIINEARVRASWTLVCIILTCGYSYWSSEYLLFVFTRPFIKISKANCIFICTQLTESLYTYITTSIILSLFFCTPYLIYQMWCFLIPSCNDYQRQAVVEIFILSSFAFIIFLWITYSWVMPNIWFFLYNMSIANGAQQSELFIIKLQPKIYDFILLSFRLLLIASICSQIPVLIIFCIEYNLISIENCIKQRRSFVLVSALFAALVTPPDICCQILAWIPIYSIFELTLLATLIRFQYKLMREAHSDATRLRRHVSGAKCFAHWHEVSEQGASAVRHLLCCATSLCSGLFS